MTEFAPYAPVTAALYQRLRPLRSGDGDADILALEHYPHLASVLTVPVSRIEFPVLAAHYPLLWQDGPAGPEPVVLGGLIPGQSFLTVRRKAKRDLPLLLLAYPFAAPHYTGAENKVALLIDEGPGSVGVPSQPVFAADGQLTAPAEQCGRALQIFLSDQALTLAISKALAEEGLLAPWRGQVAFTDQQWQLEGLMSCRHDAEETAGFRRLLDAFGTKAAMMVEAHRISLMTLQALAERHATLAAGGEDP
jgi:hypothetical protein